MTAVPLSLESLARRLTVGRDVSWGMWKDPRRGVQIFLRNTDHEDPFRQITDREWLEPLDLVLPTAGDTLSLMTVVAYKWRVVRLKAPWTLGRALTAIWEFYQSEVPGPAAIADVLPGDADFFIDADKLATLAAGRWPDAGLKYSELISGSPYFEGFTEMGPGLLCVKYGT